jgi:hypothetical protein
MMQQRSGFLGVQIISIDRVKQHAGVIAQAT